MNGRSSQSCLMCRENPEDDDCHRLERSSMIPRDGQAAKNVGSVAEHHLISAEHDSLK
jgi:hypothetical protein